MCPYTLEKIHNTLITRTHPTPQHHLRKSKASNPTHLIHRNLLKIYQWSIILLCGIATFLYNIGPTLLKKGFALHINIHKTTITSRTLHILIITLLIPTTHTQNNLPISHNITHPTLHTTHIIQNNYNNSPHQHIHPSSYRTKNICPQPDPLLSPLHHILHKPITSKNIPITHVITTIIPNSSPTPYNTLTLKLQSTQQKIIFELLPTYNTLESHNHQVTYPNTQRPQCPYSANNPTQPINSKYIQTYPNYHTHNICPPKRWINIRSPTYPPTTYHQGHPRQHTQNQYSQHAQNPLPPLPHKLKIAHTSSHYPQKYNHISQIQTNQLPKMKNFYTHYKTPYNHI